MVAAERPQEASYQRLENGFEPNSLKRMAGLAAKKDPEINTG
jgi:hypothetical protein